MIFAEILPPEPFVPDQFQQMILDQAERAILLCTIISVILILQLFFGFIKPQGHNDNDEIF